MLSNASVGTYTYPSSLAPRPHTPTVVDGETLAYDANGNMTVGLAGKQITYDYNNRPTNVVFGGQTTVYTYGADGARQTKTVGAVETFYAGMVEIRDLGGAAESIILQPHPDFRLVDGACLELYSRACWVRNKAYHGRGTSVFWALYWGVAISQPAAFGLGDAYAWLAVDLAQRGGY